MIASPTGGLSDAGGMYQTSYDNLPYATSRGFTSPTDIPAPGTNPTNPDSGALSRFSPTSLGSPISTTPVGGDTLSAGGNATGNSSDGTSASAFDKLLAAFGSLGGASGGGGGSGLLRATQVPVQSSSSGVSMGKLVLYGAIGVAIWWIGKKQGWW